MTLVAVAVVGLVAPLPAYAGGSSCGASVNPVVCENQQPGTPESDWDIAGAGDASIQGYATDISVDVGQTITFKIKTDASAYTIDIYRLGWYGGDGARKEGTGTVTASLPQSQPDCVSDPTTGITDCGNWAASGTWAVPSTAVSGVYLAKLTRTYPDGSQGASHIPFVVRDDASTSDVFFQTSDTTWEAYNTYGGANFYPGGTGPDGGRAYKLSYNRPFGTRGDNAGRDFLFSNEYPMIRFLERNGYDMSYTTGVDSDRRGSLIKNHKVFLTVGHDEYWSGQQRANVEAARDAGVNLAFFSGNQDYWKTRWEPSEDGSNTDFRTLVCYKETWDNAKIDPSSEWTGTWRDPRFTPPSNGGRPENALAGTLYMANSDDLPVTVPAAQGRYRIWRNSSVASQALLGFSSTLADHTVGYESEEDLDNGFRPAGLIDLSTTVGATPQELRDFGNLVTAGTTTHHVTLYRAPSGALVFSAGSIQWAWGVEGDHDGIESPADPSMEQATVNILADMRAQPATRDSALSPANPSTDTTPPTAVITSPTGGSVASGTQVVVQGTATDVGGVVAGVEVSTDGGTTWHPASGTTSWTYTFYATGLSGQPIQARAVDDSANIGPSTATVRLSITGRYSIFGDRVPQTPATTDTPAVELGVKLRPQTSGYVTGIRFYKGSGNTGTHTGSLWTASGTRLATGIFTNESASGWQTLTFANPVPVSANTVYVASYYAPSGHYAADSWQFSAADFVSPPLSATRSLGTDLNGLFRYGADAFPNQSFGDANYYVDVTFISSQAPAPTVVSVTPSAGATFVPVTAHPSALFSTAMDPSTIQFTLKDPSNATVPGTVAYDATSNTATFTPSAPLSTSQTYTMTVQGRDADGVLTDSPLTSSFTTDAYAQVDTLFAADATPSNPAAADTNAVELGVRFVPQQDGLIIGVRYYQGPGNGGTHVGNLWNASGGLLASATFTGETGSGWQSVRFASPVAVSAGTAYVASYYAPNGNYAADAGYFAAPLSNGLLKAPSSSNGVYHYGGDAFPASSYNATNYWVDPLFVPSGSGSGSAVVSLFDDGSTPANADWNDNSAITVGVKFTSDVAGTVTAVRFYKGASNTGTHVGALWAADGTLLASGTFGTESATGWQTLTFSQPVTITSGTAYVASYFAPVGQYSADLNAFTAGYDAPPLHVVAGGGLYHYGSASAFPDGSTNHNFWVDVVVQPAS